MIGRIFNCFHKIIPRLSSAQCGIRYTILTVLLSVRLPTMLWYNFNKTGPRSCGFRQIIVRTFSDAKMLRKFEGHHLSETIFSTGTCSFILVLGKLEKTNTLAVRCCDSLLAKDHGCQVNSFDATCCITEGQTGSKRPNFLLVHARRCQAPLNSAMLPYSVAWSFNCEIVVISRYIPETVQASAKVTIEYAT